MKRLLSLLAVIILTLGIMIFVASCTKETCDHVYGEWTVIDAPTCTKGGYSTRVCSACGDSQRTILYPSDHTYSDNWSFDGSYHWRAADCEHADQTADYAAHVFDGTTNCTVCGAVKASQGLEYEGNLVDQTYTVIGLGETLETDIVVAKYYNGTLIAAIGEEAFANAAGLNSVWLQEYILVIGDRAFAGSTDLTKVTITNGTTYFGSELFSGCTSLEHIVFRGTTSQFEAIEKADDWDAGAESYIIECFDGYIQM